MNEQDISKAVEAVLGQMNGQHAHHGEGHVCRCNKNKMTLKLANALIEKVKAYAQKMGVNVVIAVSDQAGRPVAVQCMDDAYIASFDIALNKTFTSASLKMSTEELSHLSQPATLVNLVEDTSRASAAHLMEARGFVDLLIPRGGKGLIRALSLIHISSAVRSTVCCPVFSLPCSPA